MTPALGHIAFIAVLILSLGVPANSDQAGSAFKRGQRAESKNDYDTAYQEYNTAYHLRPDDARYLVSYLRVRGTAAESHIEKGQELRREGKLQEALNEFRHAADIDDTNAAGCKDSYLTEPEIVTSGDDIVKLERFLSCPGELGCASCDALLKLRG